MLYHDLQGQNEVITTQKKGTKVYDFKKQMGYIDGKRQKITPKGFYLKLVFRGFVFTEKAREKILKSKQKQKGNNQHYSHQTKQK